MFLSTGIVTGSFQLPSPPTSLYWCCKLVISVEMVHIDVIDTLFTDTTVTLMLTSSSSAGKSEIRKMKN